MEDQIPKFSNRTIMGATILVLVVVVSLSFFDMGPGSITGYSVSEQWALEAEEARDISWPTSERPVNSEVFSYEVTEEGAITLPAKATMPGTIVLDFDNIGTSKDKVLVGSYMIIRRNGAVVNMGFTIMQGRTMYTGSKFSEPGSYEIEYYVKLDDGTVRQGTISFDVTAQ
jgi:hypothetical protein